ncbi:hypothetical protein [Teredinibacter turnerae]|uniref:hypothetical protein n=1 Tax=Teredinibacter turnerae TaxID=2426 RepID=UPI0004109970|nr:hypothetical protein [Teredinibacter turnerae]
MKKIDINGLYEETKLISSFIHDSDSRKPEVIPGMKEIVKQTVGIVDETFKENNLQGMKMLNRDFKEMAQGLNPKELEVLNAQLVLKGFNRVNA